MQHGQQRRWCSSSVVLRGSSCSGLGMDFVPLECAARRLWNFRGEEGGVGS